MHTMTDDANFTRHFYSVYFPASTVNSIRKKREKKKKKKKEKKREREKKVAPKIAAGA